MFDVGVGSRTPSTVVSTCDHKLVFIPPLHVDEALWFVGQQRSVISLAADDGEVCICV